MQPMLGGDIKFLNPKKKKNHKLAISCKNLKRSIYPCGLCEIIYRNILNVNVTKFVTKLMDK